jgi:hypothetical protein
MKEIIGDQPPYVRAEIIPKMWVSLHRIAKLVKKNPLTPHLVVAYPRIQ